jgi:hypothetical protein
MAISISTQWTQKLVRLSDILDQIRRIHSLHADASGSEQLQDLYFLYAEQLHSISIAFDDLDNGLREHVLPLLVDFKELSRASKRGAL